MVGITCSSEALRDIPGLGNVLEMLGMDALEPVAINCTCVYSGFYLYNAASYFAYIAVDEQSVRIFHGSAKLLWEGIPATYKLVDTTEHTVHLSQNMRLIVSEEVEGSERCNIMAFRSEVTAHFARFELVCRHIKFGYVRDYSPMRLVQGGTGRLFVSETANIVTNTDSWDLRQPVPITDDAVLAILMEESHV